MGSGNPNNARVRHALLRGLTTTECLSTLDNTCNAGTQCAEVQGSQAAKTALGVLQSALTTAHVSLNSRVSLAQALMAAISAVQVDMKAVKLALSSYEAAVGAVAVGDASVINKAGLLAQSAKTPAAALAKVTLLRSKVGKHPMEAVLSWPAAPGATSYAIETNTSTQSPSTGTWVELGSGASRRRVVKGPAVASQLLARVAAVASDGTRSDWSDAVLVTTL